MCDNCASERAARERAESRAGRYEAMLRLVRHYATRIAKRSEEGDTVWCNGTATNIVEAVDVALEEEPASARAFLAGGAKP